MPGLGFSSWDDSKTRYLRESSENIVFSLIKAIYSYVNSFACLRSVRKLRLLLVVAGVWMGGVSVWG